MKLRIILTCLFCLTWVFGFAQEPLEQKVERLESEIYKWLSTSKDEYLHIKDSLTNAYKNEKKDRTEKDGFEFTITSINGNKENNKVEFHFTIKSKDFDKDINMSEVWFIDGNQQVHYLNYPGKFKNTNKSYETLRNNIPYDYSIVFDGIEHTTLMKGLQLKYDYKGNFYEVTFKDIPINW